MKDSLKSTILISFLSMIALPVFAVNYGFMSNSAMSYFTKEDWQIFNKTQAEVLNKTKDGVKVNWSNPRSGSHGYMVASGTSHQNGMTCRYLTVYNTANLINGEGTFKFCKNNGKWMIY